MSTLTDAATAKGIINVDALAAACYRHGLSLAHGLAILEKETHGHNIFGHDHGGAMRGAGTVTEPKYRQFRQLIDTGHTSNGVGPMQITWKGFFPQMEKEGLKPWVPADNIDFGIGLLASSMRHFRKMGQPDDRAFWSTAKAYNGDPAYADDAASKAKAWAKLLDGGYPTPTSHTVYASKLVPGQTNSDSVWYVQSALNAVPLVDGADLELNGDYNQATVAEVKKFQQQKCHDEPDGDLGPLQATELFRLARMSVTIRK